VLYNTNQISKISKHYNYCVVGSGIGGTVLADVLKNSNVAVIEAGNFKHNKQSADRYISTGRPFRLTTTTSISVGGTSNLWHGVLSNLDNIDFQKRSWIPNSGWPISLETLRPFYKRSLQFFGLNKPEYLYNEYLNDVLELELKRIKHDPEIIKNKLFLQNKQLISLKNHLKKIGSNKKLSLDLYYNFDVKEVNLKGEKVKSIIGFNTAGKKISLSADVFILCCGALETPRILFNSKSLYQNNDFNNHDILGRFLMDHPMGNLYQVKFPTPLSAPIYSDFEYKKNQKIKSGFVFSNDFQESHRLANHNFFLRPSFIEGINNESESIKLAMLTFKDGNIDLKKIFSLIRNPNAVFQILVYKFSLRVLYRYADVFFVTEQIPHRKSFVKLSGSQSDSYGYSKLEVNWKLTKYDIENVKKCFELNKHALRLNNFKSTHQMNDINWETTLTSAAHHVGTARMGTSMKNGVVDRNLKVFGTSNLFISDGSVFTTSGNVNSGLTIAALSLRLGEHLISL